MNIKKLLISTAAGALMLGATIAPAFADSYSTNFESFTLGTINAQNGWSSLGSIGAGCAVYDHALDNSFGTAGFGTKSLRISNAVVSGCFGDQTFSKSLTDEVGEIDSVNGGLSGGTRKRHFEAQFDLASVVPDAQQPGLYLSVSPDRGDGSRMSYLRFEDQTGGIHVFFDDVTVAGPLGTAATFNENDIATLSRTPHTIKLTLDAIDGPANDVVKVYIDGVLKETGTSWEDYFRLDPESQGDPHDFSLENKSRTVDSLLFRTGGAQAPGTNGKGFLIDNLSLKSLTLVGPPANKDQCKDKGWKTFNNPSFNNQGECVDYVESHKVKPGKADGDIRMGISPKQRIDFSVVDKPTDPDKGNVEYWNYDNPGGVLHYKAKALCVNVNKTTKESRFMFQIPNGHLGLTGLYVVSYVKDGGTPGKTHDLYGHNATADLSTAQTWCNTGSGFSPSSYPITSGNVEIQ